MKDPEPFFIVFCCKPPTTHTSKLVHGLRLWRSIVRSMVLSITIIGNFHHQKKLEIFSFRPRVLQHSFWDTQCTEDDCRYIILYVCINLAQIRSVLACRARSKSSNSCEITEGAKHLNNIATHFLSSSLLLGKVQSVNMCEDS